MVDTDLYHLAEVLFDRFLPCEAAIPVSVLCSWKKVTMCSSHIGVGSGVRLHLLEGRIVTQILCSSPAQEIPLFSAVYLFIQLFVYIGVGLWRFILYFGL